MSSDWRRFLLGFIGAIIVSIAALEALARTYLFDITSYTNSKSLDASWAALNRRRDWTTVFLGDSEVRWGIDPDAIDRHLPGNRSFNMGIDGFSGSLSLVITPRLDLASRSDALKMVAIGVQLIEAHGAPRLPLNCRGALQRPIFASAFAIDLNLDRLCEKTESNRGVPVVSDILATVRYHSNLSMLIARERPKPIAFNSTALAHRPNGFQPNVPIKEARANHEQGWAARKKDVATHPSMRGPLNPAVWTSLVAPGGYFDTWAELFLKGRIVPLFFALPTNPILIDLQERRLDYARNSELLHEWAKRRGDVVFIDLGIKDEYDPETDYSDFRHLSIHGAEKFSSELGRSIGRLPLAQRAFASK